MTETEIRKSLVNVAAKWIGRKESNGTHREIIDIYNSQKPLPRGYKLKYTDAWCAGFASACAIVAELTSVVPTECSCSRLIELYKARGRWVENDAYIPKPADFVFYYWKDGTAYAATDCTAPPDHIGVVEKVVGNTITVIEGNYSDSVKRRTIAVNGRYIRGYGVPDYASKATASPAATATPKEVKAKGAAASFDKSLAGTYAVAASDGLHIRDGAGTGKASLAVLPNGTKVRNYGFFTETGGVKWLYIQATVNGTTYTGFSSEKYLKKQ